MRSVHLPLAVALTAVSCGGSSPGTPTPVATPAPRAVVSVLIDPDPILPTYTGDPLLPWEFHFNVQVSDSGGVAFVVTSFRLTITSTYSGLVLLTDDTNHFAGQRITGFGQRTIQLALLPYHLENGTRQCRVGLQMTFQDDLGNLSSYNGSVNVVSRDAVRLVVPSQQEGTAQ